MNDHETTQAVQLSPHAPDHVPENSDIDGAPAMLEAREDALRNKARSLGFVLHKVLSSPEVTGDAYMLLDLAWGDDFCIFSMTLDVAEEYIDEQDA